jgi:Mg-chelatase subunit ChlD
MNEDLNQPSEREQLEERVIALLLGELDTDAAISLRARLAEDADLRAFRDRMERTLGLVGEASQTPDLEKEPVPQRLAAERRAALIASFKVIPMPREEARGFPWLAVAAIVAIMFVLAGMMLPAITRAKVRAQRDVPRPSATYFLSREETEAGAVEGNVEEAPVKNREKAIRASDDDVSSPPSVARSMDSYGVRADKFDIVLPKYSEPAEESSLGQRTGDGAWYASGVPGLVSRGRMPGQEQTLGEIADGVKLATVHDTELDVRNSLGGLGDQLERINPSINTAPAEPRLSNARSSRNHVNKKEAMPDRDSAVVSLNFGSEPSPFQTVETQVGGGSGRVAVAAPAPVGIEAKAEGQIPFFARANSGPVSGAVSDSRVNSLAQTVEPEGEAKTESLATLFGRSTLALASADDRAKEQRLDRSGRGGTLREQVLTEMDAKRKLREAAPAINGGEEMLPGIAPAVPLPQVAQRRDYSREAVQEALGKALPELMSAKDAEGDVNGRGRESRVSGTKVEQFHFYAGSGASPAPPANVSANESRDKVLANITFDGAEMAKSSPERLDLEQAKQNANRFGKNYRFLAPQPKTSPATSADAPATPLASRLEALKLVEDEIQDTDSEVLGRGRTAAPKKTAPLAILGGRQSKQSGESGQAIRPALKATKRLTPRTLTPKPEMVTRNNAFSTFSLNVSDVAFKLVKASLNAGKLPEADTVRSEEFLNAFNYHDPAPLGKQRISFAWNRARNPFAHDRDVLRFSVQTAARGRAADQPLNLVVLLDASGSMERADRERIVREMLGVLVNQLKPTDKISVVSFARTPRLLIDGMAGGQPDALLRKVNDLTPEGGTNIETALDAAYEIARRHYLAKGNNRVILLTDGAANLGDVNPATLRARVETERKQGVALDCFGVGWEGYNDDLLESLSRNGDGRYGFINDPAEAREGFANLLAGALKVAAADVKTQVEFNPGRVTAWRQIGYDKHQLTKEQFRDNTVDAAEIGAAESGTALYSIQVNRNGVGPLGVVRVRFRVPSTGDYVEEQWELDYTPVDQPLESAPPAMRLAVVATGFAEWLTANPYAGNVTLPDLERFLAGVPENFVNDERPRELRRMIGLARTIAGE